ncbi:hypothetical protein B9Z55_012784 [Caenorhabditis nigoni]|nr:hypothetical protein B9Z55_012784 [Caenorhabditis nigoni]
MKCHLCDGYSTDNRSNLIRHLKDVHKCSAEDVFELREEIKKKKAERATGGDLLKCAECGQTFAVKKSLSSHISRKHRKKPENPAEISLFPDQSDSGSAPKADPELPEDMDDEEQDARVTEWYRCSNPRCHLAVHFLCASGHCVACQSSFEPHPDEDSEPSFNLDSSDDDMPGPSTSTKP